VRPAAYAVPVNQRPRVLVVEDDADTRHLVTSVLREEGYVVRTAANGRDALAILEKGWRPEVMLCDLAMPEMDGVSFLAARSAIVGLTEVPVLLLSATHATTLPQIAAGLDVAAYLAKPFRIDVLIELVHRLTGREDHGAAAE
jgi:CheY-like chemotaxis protein